MGVYALLVVSVCCGAPLAPMLYAQNPPQAPPQTPEVSPPATQAPQAETPQVPTDPSQTPPTLEERNNQIREFDPLDRDDKDKAKDQENRDAEKRLKEGQTPTPGSIAESELNSAPRPGPQVVDDDAAGEPVQEYNGPAVLSRSYAVNRPLIPQQLKWEESLGVNSIYDTGVARSVNPDGTPGAVSPLYGTQLQWQIGGRHFFRHDQVAAHYSGNFTQYSGAGGYTGANQTMTADYTHVLSRRLTLNLVGTGMILSQNSILENLQVGPQTIANVDLASSPNVQIFDLGLKEFTTQADVTWQKSARLSFNMGTSLFGISRNNPQLLGVTGRQAKGDLNFRVTRQMTIGASYSFSEYVFPNGLGHSSTNTYGGIFSYAFNRSTQFRFRGGISTVQSLGLETVPINPAVAALLGVPTGVIDASNSFKAQNFSVQFVKDFRNGSTASLAYASGITPGNGVLETAEQQSITGIITFRVFRDYLFSVAGGRDTLISPALITGKYQSVYGRLSLSRTFKKGFGLSFVSEYRHFALDVSGYVDNQLRITSGFTWSPGGGRLWPF